MNHNQQHFNPHYCESCNILFADKRSKKRHVCFPTIVRNNSGETTDTERSNTRMTDTATPAAAREAAAAAPANSTMSLDADNTNTKATNVKLIPLSQSTLLQLQQQRWLMNAVAQQQQQQQQQQNTSTPNEVWQQQLGVPSPVRPKPMPPTLLDPSEYRQYTLILTNELGFYHPLTDAQFDALSMEEKGKVTLCETDLHVSIRL